MDNWTKQIEEVTEKFQKSFGHLSENDLNWKPSPGTWSIAENITHLIEVNSSYFPGFNALTRGNYKLPFIARFGFVVNFFGNMILKSVQPDRKNKMKTFPMWKPSEGSSYENILERFSDHQSALKREIAQVMDKTRENAVISSPANKNIVYRLGTAFDIIVAHEFRHYEQAKEVLKLIEKKLRNQSRTE